MELKCEKIKMLIREKGFNQTEFAEKMGISKQSLNGWLSGDRKPKTANVKKIANILGVEIVEITKDFEDMVTMSNQWQRKAEKIMNAINKRLLNDKSLPDNLYRKIMQVVAEEMNEEEKV